MAEISLPLPKLDDAKAAKIAQSDKWGALSRLASIFAAGVTTLLLAPLVIWGFVTIQQSAITLTDHTRTIADVQLTVSDIKAQAGPDHDALTVLKTQMESVIAYIWHRPTQPAKTP